jgi:hypothetical protein
MVVRAVREQNLRDGAIVAVAVLLGIIVVGKLFDNPVAMIVLEVVLGFVTMLLVPSKVNVAAGMVLVPAVALACIHQSSTRDVA